MSTSTIYLIMLAFVFCLVAYYRFPFRYFGLIALAFLADRLNFGQASLFTWVIVFLPAVALVATLIIKPIRQQLFSRPLFHIFKKILPELSKTEREAINAGDVWWERELMDGKPNYEALHQYPKPTLTEEEKAFIDGPVAELCRMIDDWTITHELTDLPAPIWAHLKQHGYFGMIIPKSYGGKAFSAYAHAEVITRISAHSVSAGVTVSVPNSLGPAELLLHYGTEEQKDYYLPRLASGKDIPCFALTSPKAGSDAGSIPDYGIVTRGIHEGKEVIGIRLNWDKRYITLAPVATILGLAFKLYDPDHLIGTQYDYGITCALIPTNTHGITIGRRHYPLNVCFQNGPTQGKDVFVPLSYIIGGEKMAGKGWSMLMECLSAGRAISLPSVSSGPSSAMAVAAGGYARIRQQFKLPIGYFEGVEEALTRMGGLAYIAEATRVMTVGAIDLGLKPAIAGAISKYHVTEISRKISMDVMDVLGGKGICMGPNNFAARFYQAMPIAITVEGANILTRSMIIFGQGALRCHPYALKEVYAVHNPDKTAGLRDFDKAFFGHAGFILSNFVRTLLLSITAGHLTQPKVHGHVRRYYQHVTRLSAALALTTDMAMGILGGDLKRREKLSARLGDVLSYLYLTTAVLKRFHDEGEHASDLPFVDWSCRYALSEAEGALMGFYKNFPVRSIAWVMRFMVFPYGRRVAVANDKMGYAVARTLLSPNDARTRLCASACDLSAPDGIYTQMQETLIACIAVEPIEKRISQAVKAGTLPEEHYQPLYDLAMKAGVITEEEYNTLKAVELARMKIINVDDFPGFSTLKSV
ncbi:MAG: acyl-CoA dehydrogenase [Gammaproteobacteria bacterium]